MRKGTGRVLADISLWDDLGERVSCLAWSPDGSLLAVGSLGGDGVIFTAAGTPLDAPVHNGLGVLSVAWSPDGAHLAVGGQDAVVTLWDVVERRGESLHHRNWIESLAWSASPAILAVGAGADVVVYRTDGSLVADLAFQPGTVGAWPGPLRAPRGRRRAWAWVAGEASAGSSRRGPRRSTPLPPTEPRWS